MMGEGREHSVPVHDDDELDQILPGEAAGAAGASGWLRAEV